MPRIALASALAAVDLDPDLHPLTGSINRVGGAAEIACWDDPTIDWASFDAVVLRSTWDYPQRLAEFLAWIETVAATTVLINPIGTVRWNIDKTYLSDLADRGVPTVPTTFVRPGESFEWPTVVEIVVKPSISAGSRDTARFAPSAEDAARRLVESIWASGRTAMLQPYVASVDDEGEEALIFIDGAYTHSFHKGPLLAPDTAPTDALFAPETIDDTSATPAQLEVARTALDTATDITGSIPVYARIDLVNEPAGPVVLELELVEPSLYHHAGPGSADVLARAVMAAVDR